MTPFQRATPIAAAATLLLSFACDTTSLPVSPTDNQPLFAAGNNDKQSASGHAFFSDFYEYTFSATELNGRYTGHISVTEIVPSAPPRFLEGEVDCIHVVPGTTHAYMSAHVTSDDANAVVGQEMFWTVTDGGNGAHAAFDAASSIVFSPSQPACTVVDFPPLPDERNSISVKP
jgi:hypothetical protein